ncbi:MFS transporter [Archangium primigenium]|uniref:MFS transporter n=1 Tax=[Archangium] primigenium TaxID=2792470 RepID=UPI00195823FC|nr:MFS transporter [Archangium primigenium]MBM7116967.1 MFS transporter [Archangium primigenium]
MQPSTSTPSSPRIPLGAWYGLTTLILASICGNSVMQVMALLTEPIKQELSLSDTEIGALRGLGATLVVALAAYPIGWLADRVDRRRIFAVCIFIWCAATAASGLARDYEMLFVFAMGISVGEAVLGPVTYSLIPDLFPPARRMLANSIFFVSQLLGYAVGLALGGLLIGAVERSHAALPEALASLTTWRIVFILVALPGIVLIPMMLAIPLREAARGGAPGGTAPAAVRDGLLEYCRANARTLLSMFAGFGAIGAANFTVFGWIAVVIVRLFNVTPAEVGVTLGQVFAVGSVLGVTAANLLAKRIARRDVDAAPVRVAQLGALAALGFSLLYLFATTPTQFYVIATLQIAASFGGLALSPTVNQGIAPARVRARLMALGGMFYVGFGALSPLVVGIVSDALGPEPRNLLTAMMLVAVPGFVGGALLLRFGEGTLRQTMETVRADDAVFTAPAG